MTDEDFDEDVITKNSPLYQYMDEVGITQEAGEISDQHASPPPNPEKISVTLESQESSWRFFQSKSMCNKLWLHYVSKYMKNFHCIVLKADILCEDDRQAVAFLSSSWPSAPVTFDVMRFLLRKSLSAAVLFLCLAWMALLSTAICVFFLFLLLVLIVISWRLRSSHSQVHGASTNLEGLVTVAERLDGAARKAVLFIQESEIVARGFTFVSVRGVINNVEASRHRSQRQCPHLRKVLFFAMRHCVRLLRCRARQLVRDLPAIREHDAQHCLADLEEKEYGECFSEMDEERAMKLTDHFAIPALRAMQQLYELHFSEILRLLTFAAFLTVTEAPHTVLDFRQFEYLNRTESLLLRHLEQVLVEVERHLEAHKRAAMGGQEEEEEPQEGGRKKEEQQEEENENQRATTALHSLSLHLQAALIRSRALEKDFAFRPSDLLSSELTSIAAELSASSACLDETTRLLSPRRPAPPSESRAAPSEEAGREAAAPAPPTKDFVIRDEVLEAFVESDLSDREEGEWMDDGTFASREEARARRQKQKEESAQLLSELKSVIAVRAKSWARRERRALRRRRLGAAGDVSSTSGEEEQAATEAEEKERVPEPRKEEEPEEAELRRRRHPGQFSSCERTDDRTAPLATGPPISLASMLAAAATVQRGTLGAGAGAEDRFGDSSCSGEEAEGEEEEEK